MTIFKRGKEFDKWKADNTPDRCPLCERSMRTFPSRNRVVDHDHTTGEIRGVLCRNCNGLEGKVFNICRRAGNFISNIQWLHNLIQYWQTSAGRHLGVYYPGTKIVKGKHVAPKIKRRRRKK